MENKKQDKLKETFIFIALLVLMILRFFKLGEDSTFVKSIGYIGRATAFNF